ncbi:hypothetical protein LTS08_004625 [Lithohypha guttulata]|nr:hypothetical protein LTS08_004625 [Lithohypha guttulata]
MASTAGSTPAPSALVPSLQRQPSLCIKPPPSSAVSSPTATSPPLSLTSKEWVVPPRPKPGRKPATDTPPTKRKAQNRAAQRAFRERRAARVGELEEQLKEIEDQNEQDQDSLRSEIAELGTTLERCQADLASWVSKCQKLEAELAQAHERLLKQQKSLPPLPNHVDNSEPMGCGNCTLESHCQCIDDVVKGMGKDAEQTTYHTRPQAEHGSPHKRIKLEPSDSTSMEIDFTAAFARGQQHARPSHTSARVLDPCGFCQDGTPCICAEMAAEQDRQNATRPSSPLLNTRQVPRQMAQFTPPPSEGDVANLSMPSNATCASGPGTCAQCVADPNSTLFCKSLAASRGNSGCCGGRGAGGGCCQSSVALPPRATRSRTAGSSKLRLPEPSTRNPITLSCADAYTALSRHSAYDQASGDMASWMPKLQASSVSVEGRPAMEIDAANVMSVLKDFDRRFGSSK